MLKLHLTQLKESNHVILYDFAELMRNVDKNKWESENNYIFLSSSFVFC